MSAKDRETIRNLIEKSQGRFFSVDFEKKNGEKRHMTARLGVKKHLRGGHSPLEGKPEFVTVFDAVKGEYRAITLDKVSHVRVNGTDYFFQPEGKTISKGDDDDKT